MPTTHAEAPNDAPDLRPADVLRGDVPSDVLIHAGDDWHRAELQGWSQDETGEWWATVCWHGVPAGRLCDVVPAQQVWEAS